MNTNVSYSSKITDIMLWTIQAINHFLLAIQLPAFGYFIHSHQKKLCRFEIQTCPFSISTQGKKIDRREY